jgi:DNA repair photolyase
MASHRPLRGRGTSANPKGRFERIELEPDPELDPEEAPRPRTQLLRDASRTLISRNTSPDVPFDASINPYRGCEHGCSYCYARPFHEFLGFSAGLDFETRIVVKENAPELLRAELMAPSWKPQLLGLSGVTDPYQPVERQLGITRRCLEVLAEFRNPVAVVTKNHLVTRDADHLSALAAHDAASVAVSITTLDPELAGRLEPRASSPRRRLAAIEALAAAGVKVGALVAPIIPGLNDHEIPAILKAVAQAGGHFAGYTVLRLPHGVADIFSAWLEEHYPDRKGRVLARVQEMREGQLHDPRFGHRMRGQGIYAGQIRDLFRLHRRQNGLENRGTLLSTAAFRRPGEQLSLFSGVG